MLNYVLRRLLLAIPLTLAVVTLLFVLVELAPGVDYDYVAQRTDALLEEVAA